MELKREIGVYSALEYFNRKNIRHNFMTISYYHTAQEQESMAIGRENRRLSDYKDKLKQKDYFDKIECYNLDCYLGVK